MGIRTCRGSHFFFGDPYQILLAVRIPIVGSHHCTGRRSIHLDGFLSVSKVGSYRPLGPSASRRRLSRVRLSDLTWLSIVRDGSRSVTEVSVVAVQDSLVLAG